MKINQHCPPCFGHQTNRHCHSLIGIVGSWALMRSVCLFVHNSYPKVLSRGWLCLQKSWSISSCHSSQEVGSRLVGSCCSIGSSCGCCGSTDVGTLIFSAPLCWPLWASIIYTPSTFNELPWPLIHLHVPNVHALSKQGSSIITRFIAYWKETSSTIDQHTPNCRPLI